MGGRRAAQPETTEPRESVLANIGAGLAYAWRDPAVRSIILLTAAFNFAFTGPVSVGLPYLAKERFGGGPAEFGLMLSMFGAARWWARCGRLARATCRGWAWSCCSSRSAWGSAWRWSATPRAC